MTCSFLRLIHGHYDRVPILVLVDCDPDGINIFRCYRDGISRQNSHTDTAVYWLGIKTSQVYELGATQPSALDPDDGVEQDSQPTQSSIDSRTSLSSTSCRDPVSRLTSRDRKLAIGMLRRLEDSCQNDEQSVEMKRELQMVLCMGVKAEIQWLDESGNLTGWLDQQISIVMDREI